MATIKKACKGVSYPKSSSVSKRLGSPSKAKSGGSFPDLNKDGKITKADILVGRGVIKGKKGMKVKKAQVGYKLLPGQKPSKEKPVNNYDKGPIFGGNKELPKNKKEASELKRKNDSENSTIQKSLKSTFDNVNKNRYSKGSMKKGGTMKKSMKTGGK